MSNLGGKYLGVKVEDKEYFNLVAVHGYSTMANAFCYDKSC